MPGEDEIEIRRALPADDAAVVDLAAEALGWTLGEPNDALFRWKHRDNPFGSSPTWVAVAGDRLVAVRTLMRWEFDDPHRGVQRAVRAVDTATHPDFQGRWLFSRATRQAVDELTGDGCDFVFNTPNAASRPGYIKMGWVDIGRVPVAVLPRSLPSSARLVRARVPAGKWSLDTAVGEDPALVLADTPALDGLLAAQPPASGLRTRRTSEFLRWRYAAGPVRYRVLLRSSRLEDGFAVFRLRSRGAAVEATVCDVIVPEADRRLRTALVRTLMRDASPDYAIAVQREPVQACGVRLPAQGPRLTWRALARTEAPAIAAWDLRLGDVELF